MTRAILIATGMAILGFLLGRQLGGSENHSSHPTSQSSHSILPNTTVHAELPPSHEVRTILTLLEAHESSKGRQAFAKFARAKGEISRDPLAILRLSSSDCERIDPDTLKNGLAIAAQRAPHKTLEFASTLPRGILRATTTRNAIQALGRNDPLLGRELVMKHLRDLFEPPEFLLDDLESAKALHASLPYSALRDHLARDLAETWAEENPQAALEWISRQDQESHLAEAVLRTWLKSDLDAAGKALAEMPPLPHIADLRQEIVNEVIQHHGYEAALTWSERHLPSSAQANAKAAALQHLATDDPLEAVTLAVEWGAQPAEVLDTWVRAEPEKALAWAAELPDAELAESLVQSGVRTWASEDPAAAASQVSHWAADGQVVPDNTFRDISRRWLQDDPIKTIEWLGQWPDAEQAIRSMEEHVHSLTRGQLNQVADSMVAWPADRMTEPIRKVLIRRMERMEGNQAAEELRNALTP